jgi:L-ascorbate metabolism protein UlaG (beta-lactamase superfamily)
MTSSDNELRTTHNGLRTTDHGLRTTFPVSDHCDGERFFNPHASTDRSVRDLIRWWRTRQTTPWPTSLALNRKAAPPPVAPVGRSAFTFIGHSTFLVQLGASTVLTDPVFTTHAGPFGRFGPPRVRPPALRLDELPHIDAVLVSHNHYDHLQPSSLRELQRRFDPVFVAPLGVGEFLARRGLARVVQLDWWQTGTAGRVEITATPAQHFSARTPFDRNRTLWAGFALRTADALVYYAGDTGYSPQFAEIGRRLPGIGVALLPIGAYEPRWFMKPMHVDPEEAVRMHVDLGARVSVAMHFGTFRLTDEPIDEPAERLVRACAAAGLDETAFRVPEFGETLIL